MNAEAATAATMNARVIAFAESEASSDLEIYTSVVRAGAAGAAEAKTVVSAGATAEIAAYNWAKKGEIIDVGPLPKIVSIDRRSDQN